MGFWVGPLTIRIQSYQRWLVGIQRFTKTNWLVNLGFWTIEINWQRQRWGYMDTHAPTTTEEEN